MAAAAAEQQQFYLLLGNLLSPDNVVRKQAEVTELAAPDSAPEPARRPFPAAAAAPPGLGSSAVAAQAGPGGGRAAHV